jgi:hypothetical protein
MLHSGGITVQYYLAKLLDEYGINVRMYPSHGTTENCIFNKFYNNDFEINNCFVIYCEGIIGNPLNAKKVIRWMLSPLGKNIPYHTVNTWSKDELVYYFNHESKFNDEKIHKMLTTLYINPEIKNYGFLKEGHCHSFRKIHFYGTINNIHPPHSYEIPHTISQDDCIKYFNKFKYFTCYDPLSFLIVICVLCGCVPIVYPVENLSKDEWLKNIFIGDYIKQTSKPLYGIAYGNDPEEIKFATNTIELAKEQWENDISFYYKKHINSFINDLLNFENNLNTIENNYLKIHLTP